MNLNIFFAIIVIYSVLKYLGGMMTEQTLEDESIESDSAETDAQSISSQPVEKKRNKKRKEQITQDNLSQPVVESQLTDHILDSIDHIEASLIDPALSQIDQLNNQSLGQVEHLRDKQKIGQSRKKGRTVNWRQAMIYQQILNPPKAKQVKSRK